mgnify:CR=1 FL=1
MTYGEERDHFPDNLEPEKKSSGFNVVLWIICLAYVISPVDLFPGPIDDVIVSIVTFGLTSLFKH